MNMSSVNLPCMGQQHRKESPAMQPSRAGKRKTTLSTPVPFRPSPVFSPSSLRFLEERRASVGLGINHCSHGSGSRGLSCHKEDVVVPEFRRPTLGRRPSLAGAERFPCSAVADRATKHVDPVKAKSKLYVQRTVKDITKYLIEAGETADNASFIVERMLRANDFLLDMDLGGIIMIGSIDEFWLKTKQEMKQTLLSSFPDFNLSSSQQTLVIERLFATLPMTTLTTPEPPEDVYEDALMHVLHNDSDNFACPGDILKQIVLRKFSKKCMNQFPEWHLTDSQKRIVVDKLLKTLPISDMATFELEDAFYLNALVPAISSHPDKFKSIDETLRHLFGKKFLCKFPDWPFTDVQKVAVVDRILKTLPISELPTCKPQEFHYRDALTYEASDGCMRCPVCMDPMVEQKADGSLDTSQLWFAQPRKTEHWSNNPCGHACCRSCMSQWAETIINDQKTSVKCPVPGCSYRLWNQDLGELVTKKVLKHHKEHERADHFEVLAKLSKSKRNADLKKWLRANARPCPECHVIVSRYEGCNVMTCVCGTKFCYACGFIACQCHTNKEFRPDIWKPQK